MEVAYACYTFYVLNNHLLACVVVQACHEKLHYHLVIYLKMLILFDVYKCFACMCICVPCAWSAHIEQKRTLDPLELELQMVIIYDLGDRN